MMPRAGWVFALGVAGLLGASLAWAAPVPVPDYSAIFGGSGVGVGARALAMGGAATAAAANGTALYWNPAALGRVTGLVVDAPFTMKTNGVDWRDEYDAIRDAIDEDELGVGDFYVLRDIARSAADDMKHVDGTVAGMLGAAIELPLIGGVGVGGYAEGEFQADLAYTSGESEQVTVDGDALYVYSAGAAIGREVKPGLYLGLGLRKIWAGFSPGNVTYTYDGEDVERDSETSDTLRGDGIGIDVGVEYTPPLLTDWRFGLMLRNVNGPTIDFEDDLGGTASVDFDPCVNLGAAWQSEMLLVAADLHNVTEANNADMTWHLGAEMEVLPNILRVRAGLHDGDLTFGVGASLGPVSLALTADQGFEDTIGLQVGASF